jgi:hypothetical protein
MSRASVVALIVLLCSGVAFAEDGGLSWTFEVLEITESVPDGHIIQLRPSPPGKDFPRSCETFVIYSIFDVRDWSSTARSKISRKSHDRAIRALEQANALDRLIRLGTLGGGFAALEEKSRCEVASRALQYVVHKESGAIISFYDEP